jgi:hypothetical protein
MLLMIKIIRIMETETSIKLTTLEELAAYRRAVTENPRRCPITGEEYVAYYNPVYDKIYTLEAIEGFAAIRKEARTRVVNEVGNEPPVWFI